MVRQNLHKMHRITGSTLLYMAVMLGVLALIAGLLQSVSFSASAQTAETAAEDVTADSEPAAEEVVAEDSPVGPVESQTQSDTVDEAPADVDGVDALAEDGLNADSLTEMLGASPMALPSGGKMSCAPGDFYSISSAGEVRGFKSNGGNSFSADTSNSVSFRDAYPAHRGVTSVFNGLGISFNGDRVFAFQRLAAYDELNRPVPDGNRIAIFDWTPGSTDLSADKDFKINARTDNGNNYQGNAFGASDFIAGAVNPENGAYYLGGYSTARVSYSEWIKGHWEYGQWVPGYWVTKTGYEVRFNLYKYDPALGTLTEVGYVPVYNTEKKPTSAPNGDIAFDAYGNLFILFHDGNTTVRTVPVTNTKLKNAEQTPSFTQRIEPQSVTDLSVSVSGNQFAGLAFNYDGNLIVESSGKGRPVTFWLIDPSTGEIKGTGTSFKQTFVTDLASCGGFPTIELKKDVESRYDETDQFILEIDRLDGEDRVTVADARTEGNSTGVQEQQAGPVPAVVGETYIVRETGGVDYNSDNDPAILDRYKIDLKCVNTSTGLPVQLTEIETDKDDNSREWSFVVPQPTSYDIPIVSCTYTNASNVAPVEWTKVDGDGQKLAGSEWEIRKLNDSEFESLSISDCVVNEEENEDPVTPGAPGTDAPVSSPCELDKNPKLGEFKVADLPYGEYELVETKAPEGYKLIEPIKFTVDGTKKPLGLGDIVNELQTGDIIWKKVDEDGNALAGSVWTVTGPEGDESEELEVVDNVGQDGYEGLDIDPKPGVIKIEDLKLGKYTVVEKAAPEGYLKTDKSYEVELTTEEFSFNIGDIANLPVIVEWVKVDSEDNELLLPGSEWTLTGPNGADDVVAVVDNGDNDTDNNDGRIRVEKLPVGEYVLEETKAPEGYMVLDTKWILTITDTGFEFKEKGSEEVIASGNFDIEGTTGIVAHLGNIENTLITGSVIWEKTGTPWQDDLETKIHLGGSEWELTPVDADGGAPTGDSMTVTDWANEAENYQGNDVDSRGGFFKVEGLTPGWYKLVETKAPIGFIKDETERYVEITGDEEVTFGAINNQVYDTETLPETGGRGVFPAIALGGLIAALGALMASRRKTVAVKA